MNMYVCARMLRAARYIVSLARQAHFLRARAYEYFIPHKTGRFALIAAHYRFRAVILFVGRDGQV